MRKAAASIAIRNPSIVRRTDCYLSVSFLVAALVANVQLFGGIVENAASPCLTGGVCAGGALTHGLVPPTPGPLVMIETLQLDLGFAMVMGITLGLPVGAAGVWLALRMDKKLNLGLRESPTVKIADLESIVSKPMNNLRKASEHGNQELLDAATKLFDYKKSE